VNTLKERLLQEQSYEAPEHTGEHLDIDDA
jgi:ATP-dependent protease HslVU (ClpYQ) ATPase subunit